MKALVGYTGFVGSNLYETGQFDAVYNSKNITQAYGTRPELLVYAGLRAEKYLANHAPEQDLAQIKQAEENIRQIAPEKLVLISTVDVFREPAGKNEDAEVDTENLHPYGYNRYLLEQWVREYAPDTLIVRLPGLFGAHLKKNFIYDFIHRIPFMLKQEKMEELCLVRPVLKQYYRLLDNGFYQVNPLHAGEEMQLKELFQTLGFSALHFTDSRSRYQFYPLARLWRDIQKILEKEIRLWHPATEPVSAGALYEYLTGETFENLLPGTPAAYDYRTKYGTLFGGDERYMMSRQEVMEAVRVFVFGGKEG